MRLQQSVAKYLSRRDRAERRHIRRILPKDEQLRIGAGHQSGGLKSSQKLRNALRSFEREGWIRRDDDVVVVLDRDALAKFAQDGVWPSKVETVEVTGADT